MLSILLVLAAQAPPYACTAVTNHNPPLTQAWDQRCIPYYISRHGTYLGGEERRKLIADSFRVWSGEGNACTDLEFIDAGYTDEIAGFDDRKPDYQKNVIASIEDSNELSLFPMPGLLAITLTSFSIDTGEIFDADILLNAVNNRFDEVANPATCNRQTGPYDLANTLVHEMGHFIGFDHVDRADSTMNMSADRCEIIKRDLSDNDLLGLCTVYPSGQPSRTCKPPETYDGLGGESYRGQCDRLNEGGGGCGCDETPRRESAQAIASSVLAVCVLMLWKRRVSGR